MKTFSLCHQIKAPSLVKAKVISSISEVCTFLELTVIRHIIGNSLFPGTLNLFSFCQFSYRKLSSKLEQHSGSHIRECYKGDKSGIEQKYISRLCHQIYLTKARGLLFDMKSYIQTKNVHISYLKNLLCLWFCTLLSLLSRT